MTRHSHLRHLVRRARNDSYFLGRALEEYQQSNRIDDVTLAEFLACKTEALDRLALCRMPRPEAASFRQDVRQIAEFVSCSPDRLVQVLRQATALSSLQRPPTDSRRNTLLAARDRKEEKRREH